MGMNAWLKALSAQNARNKFGIFWATIKISAKNPAPKKFAIKMSLTKPNILEIPVKNDTMKADFKNGISENSL